MLSVTISISDCDELSTRETLLRHVLDYFTDLAVYITLLSGLNAVILSRKIYFFWGGGKIFSREFISHLVDKENARKS